VAGPGNDLRPGHRSWNVVWYRPADATRDVPRLLTDETGHTHELSIPPPLIAKDVVAEMREAAARLLPPQFRAAMALVAQPFLQPIYDLESTSMAFGRVALVGDAAFVVRPHVGAGVVKGAEDAVALAACLDAEPGIEAGLRAYEAQRIGIGRRFVAQARRLGCYLKYDFAGEEERARAAYHAEPERVLAETAVLDFLRSRRLGQRAQTQHTNVKHIHVGSSLRSTQPTWRQTWDRSPDIASSRWPASARRRSRPCCSPTWAPR
jgi:2-polyprenyl-6-methoxyphenol hydroxylase-like FAD-dependent oxidoreductase